MIGVSGDFDVIAPLNGTSSASRSMFADDGARSLAALPGTKSEINEIAKALNTKQVTLLSGAESTEAEFRRLKIDDVDIFAFATHAVMADEFEGLDEPALVFNRASVSEGTENDGLLTSSEITKLSLNADWVILSACNTAAANEAGAASFEGLTRAFLYAGADSLLVSHWPVRDDAAAFLTVNTVRYSQGGLSKAEALQKAIMDIRKNKDIPNSEHPAIWAPFVLIGNG
jgi:CHAT domain-containing protein